MFPSEAAMQAAVHEHPEILLSGIPEINPEFCVDAPSLVPLAREIQLASGAIDNLFVDVNAILTFVECKRYSDARLKREVYPQAINYASDLQCQLNNFSGADFRREFFTIVSSGQSVRHDSFSSIMDALGHDPVIEGKNLREWRRQFEERLEYNIKSGVCRIVLLCAPAPNSLFNYRGVRNLMQLMSFSEQTTARYDLVLMDIREERDALVSRIMWRRYSALPQIPLVAESSRDTSEAIDKMKKRVSGLSKEARSSLQELLTALSEHGLIAVENTYGYALKSEDTKKSTYTLISIGERGWSVVRHQIRPSESLYEHAERRALPQVLAGFDPKITARPSSIGSGRHLEIELSPRLSASTEDLVKAVLELTKFD